MKENEIIEILDHRVKKIKREYHRLQEDYDEDALHDYRSEMKKLKAFIRLLNSNRSPGEKIRIGKKMKDVYRLSGDIRNLQLHQQRIDDIVGKHQLNYPKNYMKFLDKERTTAIEQLEAAAKKLSFHQFSKNILDPEPFKIDNDHIERYFIQQINTIALVLATTTLSDEMLHDIRRHLKDIGYNRDYLPESLPITVPAFIGDETQTDTMTDKLGTFHDLCVSLVFLQPYYTSEVEERPEQEVLIAVKSEINQNYQKLKHSLNLDFGGFQGFGEIGQPSQPRNR